MSRLANQPSRKVVIAAVVLLVLGAVLTIWHPMPKKQKAEYLWAEAYFRAFGPRDDLVAARRMLDSALKLDPGNEGIQQSVVWFSRDDERGLEELIRRPDLGRNARRLAHGLVALKRLPGWADKPNNRALTALRAAIANDPGNAHPRMLYAAVLMESGRVQDALQAAEEASRCRFSRTYVPGLPPALKGTMAECMATVEGTFVGLDAHLKGLSTAMVAQANSEMRRHQTENAVGILETGIRLSEIHASSEPPRTIAVLVAAAVFSIMETELSPIYRDLGRMDGIRALRKEGAAYKRVKDGILEGVTDFMPMVVADVTAAVTPGAITVSAFLVAMCGLFLSAFLQAFAGRKRRLLGEERIAWIAWPEGWLVRRLLIVGLLTAALGWLGVRALSSAAENGWEGLAALYSSNYALGILSMLVVLALTLGRMRRRYEEETGNQARWWSFLFRSPANVKEWIRWRLVHACAAGMLFATCAFLLLIIVSKPALGYHPWQLERMKTNSYTREQAMVRKWAAEIRKASLPAKMGNKKPANSAYNTNRESSPREE